MRIQMKLCLMVLVSCLLAIPGGPFANPALAQAQEDYETLEIAAEYQDPEKITSRERADVMKYNEARRAASDKRRSMQSSVSDFLQGKSAQVSATEMEAWFSGYEIPLMAQKDDKSLSGLGLHRKSFFRRYVYECNNAQLKSRLTALVIPEMKKIVENNYHPACRVNAMVVIGEWNRREGVRNSSLPVPDPELLNYMLDAVGPTSTLPGFLRVPAMAGIQRHAQARGPWTRNPFAETEARRITDVMLSLLADSPAETNPDLTYWTKRRAVQIIGLVGEPGNAGRNAKAIRDIIMDDAQDTMLRVDAVAAYGLLDFRGSLDQAEAKQVIVSIGKLLAKLSDEEVKYIDDKINDIKFTVEFLDGGDKKKSTARDRPSNPSAGVDADSGGGGNNRTNGAEEFPETLPDYHREIVRRRIKDRAWKSKVAMIGDRYGRKGLVEFYKDPDSEEAILIEALVKDINSLMKSTDVIEPGPDEEIDEDEELRTMTYADELKKALVEGSAAIRGTLDKLAPESDPAAPADDSAEPDGAADSGQ